MCKKCSEAMCSIIVSACTHKSLDTSPCSNFIWALGSRAGSEAIVTLSKIRKGIEQCPHTIASHICYNQLLLTAALQQIYFET